MISRRKKVTLVVATKNKKKLREIRELLAGCAFTIKSLEDYTRAPRIVEDGKTFLENAVIKAMTIARFTAELTLGEDSGLCVDALDGKPGVYSSRFAGKNKSDQKNNEKLLRLLKGVPVSKRTAHYVCAVALVDAQGLVGLSEGICNGLISQVPAGNNGFGYDPLFMIPRYRKTFGQLDVAVKHSMSHRYRSLQKTKELLQKYVEHR
ncbi:MAG: RdgB/HAM1 family non-canonical purine NTP pyrophosphatase [Candidatus Omnitrophica bacterium]|nr:RdgB/HAM1 family non-canonical purine NTP pyrophosphatase [Candidatus Omnitrophota bacterium]